MARPDPARVDATSLVIRATAASIFAAFADPTAWEQWLPPAGMTCSIQSFDFRAGGEYQLELVYEDASTAGKSGDHRDIARGVFVEVSPNHRMVQRVVFESGDPLFSGEMAMRWQLDPTDEGTRVSIAATNVPPGISPNDHIQGMNHTLANLARYVEDQQ